MSTVIALLGPTNTGKTHMAMERLLEHRTGMAGFPLRLLARENYERLVKARGREHVALITGEEQIVPPRARYFVCTVEAMPVERRVDFLAIDEVQLAADRERGHVFTDRVLHARGREETMLLGAETIRPLLQKLVPEAVFIRRPRLSTLSYVPPRRLNRLPRRTAVVVFSVAELYEAAERLRRECGGAGLVFGALSPRTRNAQVGLYQAGEVDYLVATDAIGMGLNLDIDHVAFTRLVKFDGRGPRTLGADEVAQIAGRAGRHVKDGTFGSTRDLGPFDRRLVEAVENHRFEPLKTVFWRNPDLDLGTPARLLRSLEARPPARYLVRMREADDHRALQSLLGDPEIAALRGESEVGVLWEVCRVPDFSSILSEAHTRLLAQMFHHLLNSGRLPEDWVKAQVAALDRIDGDIDTLLHRIAGIRTWTYVSHRVAWLADAAYWKERTRAVEDRLSDALHERLTAQFVDRRTAVVARQGADGLLLSVQDDGGVLVQGLAVGRLEGFRFTAEPGLREEARGLLAAANRALRAEAPRRVGALEAEEDAAFSLSATGQIEWCSAPVARLVPGDSALAPRVEVDASDLLDPPLRERVRRRLSLWIEDYLAARLRPLQRARSVELPGAVRGLLFALEEDLGAVPRRSVSRQVASLGRGDRRQLARLGVTLGRVAVYVAGLQRRTLIPLRALLWSLRHGVLPGAVPDGRPSLPRDTRHTPEFLAACGYLPAGSLVVRIDRLERCAVLIRKRERDGGYAEDAELAELLGCRAAHVPAVRSALGLHRRRAPASQPEPRP